MRLYLVRSPAKQKDRLLRLARRDEVGGIKSGPSDETFWQVWKVPVGKGSAQATISFLSAEPQATQRVCVALNMKPRNAGE